MFKYPSLFWGDIRGGVVDPKTNEKSKQRSKNIVYRSQRRYILSTMAFWSKNKEDKSVFELDLKKNSLDIAELRIRIDGLEQALKSLRGLVNRKLGNEDAPIQEKKTESVKYNDGFDPLRNL